MDDYVFGALHDAARVSAELKARKIRLDVLEALEPGERQHDMQIPLNPDEIDALIAVARAAHAFVFGTESGDGHFNRLRAALDPFDWEDE